MISKFLYNMSNDGIPRIIHQIWSETYRPLPSKFKLLSKTWRHHYSDWEYKFWDNEKMDYFINENFPQYINIYKRFPFDVQRWDSIRYLILHKMGGMYVDFDYESIRPMDELIREKSCCFAQEPQIHCKIFSKNIMFTNALMACIPEHPFIEKIIETIFSEEMINYDTSIKELCVLNTTGPWKLIDLYESLNKSEKKGIYLIPNQYVTPFSGTQASQFRSGVINAELEKCIENSYAIHYFFGEWGNNGK